MHIRSEILEKWRRMYDHGDMKLLMEKYGYSYWILRTAFNGNGREQVIKDISAFYAEREKQLEAAHG